MSVLIFIFVVYIRLRFKFVNYIDYFFLCKVFDKMNRWVLIYIFVGILSDIMVYLIK